MAIKGNIIIDQGSTFSTTVSVTDEDDLPINLTGYTANAQMRKHYSSVISYAFDTSIAANTGVITLAMSSNATNSLTAGRYVYDVEITTSGGSVSRLVEGIVTVTPGVTR